MPEDLFDAWLDPVVTQPGLSLYEERAGARAKALKILKKLVVDHFVGYATVLRIGGYNKAADVIRNSLPQTKRIRSGDLCELLATEYLNSQTPFTVPIPKLRWKSDRDTAMHGNDVIGIDCSQRTPRVLKGECKSRASFAKSTAAEAAQTLDANGGRPNPSTLSFITKRLYELGRDKEAAEFSKLQAVGALKTADVTHLIFTLCGNDPTAALTAAPKPTQAGIARAATAIKVTGHSAFVDEVFKQLPHGKRS